MNTRAWAARVLNEVLTQSSQLGFCLDKLNLPEKEKTFIQAICFGVCRWFFRLDAIAKLLLEKPLKHKDQDVYLLILIGLYQLIDMRVPDHAAIAETVAAAKQLEKPWAKGLINAVLRHYQRESTQIAAKIQRDLPAEFAHPAWMVHKIQQNWPEDWQAILTANNQHPPFALRVNQIQIKRQDYLKKLADAEIKASALDKTATGIVLEKAYPVQKLPGFAQGEVSVQDGAAQLVATLLQLEPGQRILDACAAPGGKTAHILEMEPHVKEVVAIDQEAVRVDMLKSTLARLKLSAKCIVSDAADTKTWWDGHSFDRILLDAPCSASGIIRRHPDIKLLRRSEDINLVTKEQLRLLKALWPLLKDNGLLVYVTCSIFSEENEKVIQAFLLEQSDAKEDIMRVDWGKACAVGRQILPGTDGMDGFYFASLRKFTRNT